MGKMIIFDMDGTLLDSSKTISESINFVRKELSLPPLSVEKVVELINEPDKDLPKLFYEDIKPYSICRTLFEKHYYQNCTKNLKIYNSAIKLLKAIRDKYSLTVLSNAYGIFARKMIEYAKLSDYFEEVLGADDVGSRKPNPNGIFYILDKYNIKKEECLYIGDSLKDEKAAKNANIKYAFVEWGFGKYKNPDIIITKENVKNINKIINWSDNE